MEVSELNLADGEYTVEVTMEGGSGRASVQSPTELSVENGQAEAKIVWSLSLIHIWPWMSSYCHPGLKDCHWF